MLRLTISLADRMYRALNFLGNTATPQQRRWAGYFAYPCENLAPDLGVGPGRVNVKATTTEGMGSAGRGEGIAAHAVALIESR